MRTSSLRTLWAFIGLGAGAFSSVPSLAAAQSGRDGNYTVVGTNAVLNEYAVLQTSVAAGSNTITVTNILDLSSTTTIPSPFANALLVPGDLLFIVQMQGAGIDTTTPDATFGRVLMLNNAGRHEFVRVQSIAGNTITIDSALNPTGLRQSYTSGGHVQVIRVPQFSGLTVPNMTSVAAQQWDGARGGVVVLSVQGAVTLNGNGLIHANGRGFRGGTTDNDTTNGTTMYFSNSTADGARKGESIAGSSVEYNASMIGFCRGAPANGGGGGNGHNSGGGGGANGNNGNLWSGHGVMNSAAGWAVDPAYIMNGNMRTASSGGGRGGYTWGNANLNAATQGPNNVAWAGDSRRDIGGLGGRPLTNQATVRLFMGGGGGAGDGNNGGAGAGGNGGGLIYILANTIGGTGAIRANGADGGNQNSNPGDAPGGAGGGGAIVLSATTSITGIAISANGGEGGDQLNQAVNESEGPGGGGGGGFVSTTPTLVAPSVAGGVGGTTGAPAVNEFPENGATDGAPGLADTLAPTCAATPSCPFDLTTAVDIVTPADGAVITLTDTLPIGGSAENGSTVSVSIDGVVVAMGLPVALGAWTSLPITMSQGPHTIVATATDAFGNTATDTHMITIDSDTYVDIVDPASLAVVNDATPVVSGTAEPGATVVLTVNGLPAGSVVVPPSGTWSLTVPMSAALSEGPANTILAVATDTAGHTRMDSHVVGLDSMTAVDVVTPADGSTTGGLPAFMGTSEPGSMVTLSIDGGPPFPVPTSPSGGWMLAMPPMPLTSGMHTITATATDAAGNTATDTHMFNVDAATMVDIVSPIDGGVFMSTPNAVTGTCETGSTVDVFVNSLLVSSEPCTSATFTYTRPPAAMLADGMHIISVVSTDAFGNTATDSHTIRIDSSTMVDIASPADGAMLMNGSPTISGTGEGGAMFELRIDGAVVLSMTLPLSGVWSYVVPMGAMSLSNGSHTILASVRDDAGNTATDTHTLTVDSGTMVDIDTPADGAVLMTPTPTISGTTEAGATVELRVDGNLVATIPAPSGTWSFMLTMTLTSGPHTIVALATDSSSNTATDTHTFSIDDATNVDITMPADGAMLASGLPTIIGTTEAGATVVLRIDGAIVATIPAPTGTWMFTVPGGSPLSNGTHTILATATDTAGNTATDTHTITVDAGTMVEITTPADGSSIMTGTPVITGTAEVGATVELTIDGMIVATIPAPAGTWSYTVPMSGMLTDGPHTISATATDGSGNTATDTHVVTVDRMISVAIDVPADGASTTDVRPTIRGTSDPDATIQIRIDGTLVGTVVADSNGEWFLALTTPLTVAMHTVVADARDTVGNMASDSAGFTITTAGTAPFVEILTPAEGSSTTNRRPAIGGRTKPNAMVSISIDGGTPVVVTADATGLYSLTPTTDLSVGSHDIVATVTEGGMTAMDEQQFEITTTSLTVDIVTPADRSRSRDATPTITGTATPSSLVTIRIDGVIVGTVMSNGTGAWSFDAPSTLVDGSHIIDATVEMGAATATDTHQLVVDTVTVVTITGPTMGTTVTMSRPVIMGTAEPGAMVTVMIDGITVGTATAGSDGTWMVTPSMNLSDGAHSVSVSSRDDLGNTDTETSSWTVSTGMIVDPDMDDDGIPDVDECGGVMPCPDRDMDGMPDNLDMDDDNDGVPTMMERPTNMDRDSDMDGRPDHLDPDDDNDSIPTTMERPGGTSRDTDMDGRPDHLDPDDDNDTILTRDEPTDADRSGVPDYLEPATATIAGHLAGGALCSTNGTGASGKGVWLVLLLVLGVVLRRSHRAREAAAAVLVFAVVGAIGARASAQPLPLDRYHPAATALDGFTLQRPDDLGHLRWSAQLHLDYAFNPLVVERVRGNTATEQFSVVRHELVTNLSFALGLVDRVVVWAMLPVVLVQDGQTFGTIRPDGAGLGDFAIGGRVRIAGEARDLVGFAAQAAVTFPLAAAAASRQQFTGESTLALHPQLLLEIRPLPVRITANLGVLLRNDVDLIDVRVGHDLTYALGVTFPILDEAPGRDVRLDGHVELFGSSPFERFGGREESPLELFGGLKLHAQSGLTVGLGGGLGLLRGVGSPDLRLALMLAYTAPRENTPPPAPPEPPPPPDDPDRDGIVGAADQCPNDPEDRDEFEDENGCPDPDNDQDEVLDVNDGAPLIPEDRDGFEDTDGVPELDNDQDGIMDTADVCPVVAGILENRGCPDVDTDGDTVVDREDNCPREPGTVENHGCAERQQVVIRGDTLEILDMVYFLTNRDVIQPRSFPLLMNVAAVINNHPEIGRIRVEGHTDSRGRRERNISLSQRRARSVVTFLTTRGSVSPDRLESEGYGPDRPVVERARTAADHARNRRVEFHVLGGATPGIEHRQSGPTDTIDR